MRTRKIIACLIACLLYMPTAENTVAQDDVADVSSEELQVGKNENMKYFLIGAEKGEKAPSKGYGLLVVMPGGGGGRDFHGFVKRIFKNALPKGYQMPPFTFELSPEWVREYTAAVEDEAIGALDEGLVPPMAVAALAVRSLLEGAELPPGTIHLGQEMAFLKPVRLGERLSVSARVASLLRRSNSETSMWLETKCALSAATVSARASES